MRYFAIIDDRQEGPFTLDELARAGVTPDTYVWCKEMEDWQQAREVGDICRYFRQRIHSLNHPAPKTPEVSPTRTETDSYGDVPLRFRAQIERADPEKVDLDSFRDSPDLSHAPTTWFPFPMILAVITFLPLGLLAISQARKSRRAWAEGKGAEAYEYARRGKMAAGMSFSFGLLILAVLVRMIF